MNFKIIQEDGYKSSIFGYYPKFLNNLEQDILISWLETYNEFNDNERGENSISRLQKWFQQDGKYFCQHWKQRFNRWESYEYDEKLLKLQHKVQEFTNNLNLDQYSISPVQFNSCLINKYRDGSDYIKPHRDTELSFGYEPIIVGISLGCSRDLVFKRVQDNDKDNRLSKRDKEKEDLNFSLTLESGSLFIMMGSSQRFWSHEIPKSNDTQPRYSFTFREYISI
jgi:alkylated DNA repair dioxygenase AlkB